VADLLRLIAVPVLGWAAYRDVAIRRVPTKTWYPLVALGVVLLAVDGWRVLTASGVGAGFLKRQFLVAVVVSLGVVVPFAYLTWRLGGFGGADAKAMIALAVLLPTYPDYVVAGQLFPPVAGRSTLGVFSLTILTNTVILGACYPFALAARNLLVGDVSWVMLFGRPVPAPSLVERHGSLLETPEGYTRNGLDVDALRMYLRWRSATLAEVREDPDAFRNPGSVPAERNDPGDGAIDQRLDDDVATDGGPGEDGDGEPAEDGGRTADADADTDVEDVAATEGDEQAGAADTDDDDTDDGPVDGERLPNGVVPDDGWGAAAFLEDVGWGAYGTSPEDLRGGLELVATRESVWYSPGIPFIVPMFAGLVVALTLGDLLFYALQWAGLAA
jgi:preflagellin peptidase FlaK